VKVSPKADYPIRVVPESEEREGPAERYFQGIYRVVLNQMVDVVFVPDVRALAPPWDRGAMPAGLDEVTTPERARLVTALLAVYAVTPNDALAGTEERHEAGVVFYVTTAEFDRYAGELAELSEILFSRWPKETVSDLRGYEVVTFLERRVVGSAWLRPQDAAMLGRST
jgi:hypothetical protein